MSRRNFSPLKRNDKTEFRKINRPLSSIVPRTSFNNIRIPKENAQKSIKYYIENNLYEKSKQLKKDSEIKNNYNRLHKSDLMGKDKYTNFTLFIRREQSFKERNDPKNKNQRRLTRQNSAIQLNPNRMYKDNPLYLTEIIIKKHHKKRNNEYIYYNYENNNNSENFFPYIEFGDKEENTIINNHKYKNISLLKHIENDKRMNKTTYFQNPEKNYYLFQKKLEYISLNKAKGKKLYNYLEELNEYINKKYGNKLSSEKAKISYEEYKNQSELLNNKIKSLNRSNNLYNDLFVYKFNDYIKFLGKQIDRYNKNNYYLLNEIFNLQKEVIKLKGKINKLLEDKKFFNKIIFLQICVQGKKIQLPEHYDYILNHNIEESLNHYKGILKEKEIMKIFDYKQNIIYKDYESYLYQIKIYQNENREMLKKLSLVRKDVDRLDLEKKELYEEDKQLNYYLDNKLIEKTKERNDIINKYNLLNNEKNKLLKQIQFSYVNENIFNKNNKMKRKRKNSYYNRSKSKLNTNKTTNKTTTNQYTNNFRTNTRIETAKTKSISIDEQLFLDYNINYDNPQNKNRHTLLYYKVRKLFLLLSNFIEKEENVKKKDRIVTENGLILKLLTKIEEAMNYFIENESNFKRLNKEKILKIRMEMEKQRKIMKGQKQIELIKTKYENMKKKIEDKNNKIYFIPNSRKRAVSANIIKRKIKKKDQVQLINKKEFEQFLEEFNED